MTWEAWLTLGVVLTSLAAMFAGRVATDAILVAAAVVLTAAGVMSDALPSARDFAAAFGNEALVSVAVLFVVAEGLVQTGALGLATRSLLGYPKTVLAAQLRLVLPVAGVSAFLNNTPVVAMFIPVVNDWCKRTGISPSKLFIPLSYASILGGSCTLVGTSTNLVVQGLLLGSNQTPLGMFTLAPVGGAAALVGGLVLLATSRWLLPAHGAPRPIESDAREYTVEMIVEASSPIDGATIASAGLRQLPRCFLSEIVRDGETIPAPSPEQVLRGGDRLIFAGVVDSVVDLQRFRGLRPATDQVFKLTEARSNRLLVEAVVGATAPMIGKTVRDFGFRGHYNAVIIAVHRDGERVTGKIGDIVLRAGDVLLLETTPRFPELHRHSKYLLISSIPHAQPLRHDRAIIAIAALVGLVVAAALESFTHVSLLTAALLASGVMLAAGCLSVEQARRSIDLPVLVSIGAALVLGRALEKSGAAAFLGGELVTALGGLGAYGALAGVYLATLVCTELVSNNAAAVIIFPIASAMAAALGVDILPFAVVVAVAASAGFALPTGYQTHLMVYGPGGYRASDFLKVGLVLDVVVGVVAVAVTGWVFPFTPR